MNTEIIMVDAHALVINKQDYRQNFQKAKKKKKTRK